MAIDHEVTSACDALLARRFGDHDGVAAGGTQSRLQADLAAMTHQPFGAGLHVCGVLRLGGHAPEAHIMAKLVHKP
jgi:hypothetical protein